MKRSEMLDEICCCILSHSVTWKEYPLDNLLEVAKSILEMQEKLDIIIPPAIKVRDPGHFTGDDFVYYSNEWEPEDNQ